MRALSVLVTAGGTREDVDDVRCIANRSTGRLGSLIADVFTQNGAQVVYLCGMDSAQPVLPVTQTVKIGNVAQLTVALDELFAVNRFDCIIHCMAVSDYTPCAISTTMDIAAAVVEKIAAAPLSSDVDKTELIRGIILTGGSPTEKKLSSDSPDLVLTLKPTPKVIDRFKAEQPNALLVGFKLLSGAGADRLHDAAKRLMNRAGCNLVLANDLGGISGDTHSAVLIDCGGIIDRAETKQDIARMIFRRVMERISDE